MAEEGVRVSINVYRLVWLERARDAEGSCFTSTWLAVRTEADSARFYSSRKSK
jgi:hypothetical protein